MATYVLDTDVISFMARAVPRRDWNQVGPLPVAITEPVYDELGKGPVEKALVREMLVQTIAPAGAIRFETGSDAAEALANVLIAWPPPPGTDIGERSVVALSLLRDDHIAVLLDQKALYLGVEELRGRVLSMHGFLHALVTEGKIGGALAKRVSDELLKGQVWRRKPTWWPHG